MANNYSIPGVTFNINDLGNVLSVPSRVGLCIVGPTVSGKPYIPTVVSTYSEYLTKFGAGFISGGSSYEYFTSLAAYNYFLNGGNSVLVVRVASGSFTHATASIWVSGSTPSSNFTSFVLETLDVGNKMNNDGVVLSNGSLAYGRSWNIRWEIANVDYNRGVFTLNIRRGDDSDNNKNILESFQNVSLDPNSTNYIEYVIGNQTQVLNYDPNSGWYVQTVGLYPNKSQYVRVSAVYEKTPNYLSNDGTPAINTIQGDPLYGSSFSASLPQVGSGSYGGAFGGAMGDDTPYVGNTLYQNDNDPLFPQGVPVNNYLTASYILQNQDLYTFDILTTPGLFYSLHSVVGDFLALAESRGDFYYIVDMVPYSSTVLSCANATAGIDNYFAATYFPGGYMVSPVTGHTVWTPPSVFVPSAFSYTDKVYYSWFSPSGIERGGLNGVVDLERKLNSNDLATLYDNRVNPIRYIRGYNFPIIWGQKNLKLVPTTSGLDRINVVRLILNLQEFITNIAQSLVFGPNTTETRNYFVNKVTPYMESVAQRQGLYKFQIVMDDSNNPGELIDRGIMQGTIWIQAVKEAEQIRISFNVTSTGVDFSM